MKVRSFIWKCLHNIVPLNVNLFQRKMPVYRMCPKCGNEPESVDHMLFHCEQAVRVWLLSAFRFRPEEMQIARFEEVWNNLGHVIKVNVDGAFDKAKGRGGVGVVLRDDKGEVLQMYSIPIHWAHSAEMVEALEFKLAVEEMQRCEGSAFVLEGDAQRVIRMLQQKNQCSANLEVIISDVLVLLRRFSACFF
ncbi:hypothetical protein RHGRI_025480 [Rhododendron griersonianum]|uniref:Uncharacterized protein n=1 Tax=Rhododendron griersonianum TaxID=479676 RepID=A0AAV6IPI8_9ERIC|nr:hypothetical protein RHGRI_025480 [Rhododendron griersonianum]